MIDGGCCRYDQVVSRDVTPFNLGYSEHYIALDAEISLTSTDIYLGGRPNRLAVVRSLP